MVYDGVCIPAGSSGTGTYVVLRAVCFRAFVEAVTTPTLGSHDPDWPRYGYESPRHNRATGLHWLALCKSQRQMCILILLIAVL